jgi:zinc-ribbon domain
MESAMFCSKCGANLAVDAKFCAGCGTKVAGNPSGKVASGSGNFNATAASSHSAASMGSSTAVAAQATHPKMPTVGKGVKIFAAVTLGGLGLLIMLFAGPNDSNEHGANATRTSVASPAALAAARQASEAAARRQLLDKIWHAFVDRPGNSGRWLNVQGEIVKTGTVSPKAMATSFEGRLPAYLACYDYVMVVDGLGDTKSDMCIYLIVNDARGTQAVMWRGKKYMSELESAMRDGDFQSG